MEYLVPGVYVQEIPSGTHPITAVGTRTAAFLGAATKRGAPAGQVALVSNWTEFKNAYVGDVVEDSDLACAVYGFFLNGGGRCYVVNVPQTEPLMGSAAGGLELLDEYDDISMVAAPGRTEREDFNALLEHCEQELRLDRVAILDAPRDVLRAEIRRLTDSSSAQPKDEANGGATTGGLRPRNSDLGYGAFYFPWLMVRDPITSRQRFVPPSGHVAGIWARSDETRGVHKAPANETVRGALGLSYRVSRSDQALLNPAGVNCIREFPREGIRLWGARTLAPESSEWLYLNVRRLLIMIRESIAAATGWIVFEPNDETLWRSIRRDVGAFLTTVWRDGALFGRTPGEAFFVKCDAETNPEEARVQGRVETIIGVAPVRPAEFVIFKISQSMRSDEAVRTGA